MSMKTVDRVRAWRAGSAVRRYHTMDTLITDTVGKHSGGVAHLCWVALEGDVSAALLVAALHHDLPECYVGDVPSPTKQALNGGLDAMEEAWTTRHLHADYGAALTNTEKAVLTYCDAADGLLYCLEEYQRGNRPMLAIAEKYKSYLNNRLVKMGGHPGVEKLHAALTMIYVQGVAA